MCRCRRDGVDRPDLRGDDTDGGVHGKRDGITVLGFDDGTAPEVEMVVGISARGSGRTTPAYGVFRHLLNADDETFLYSTDYPAGVTVDRDRNGDERIDNPIMDRRNAFPNSPNISRSYDKLYETITFSDMTTTSFGGGNPGFNGPWDFDTNDEGFRSGVYLGSSGNVSEITNWGEDQDYDGALSGPYICTPAATLGTSCSCPGNPPGGCNAAVCGGAGSTAGTRRTIRETRTGRWTRIGASRAGAGT